MTLFTAFGLLVAIALVGRLGQPDWNVTPLAAVALLAGYAMPSRRLAIAVPLVALTASNLVLPAYHTLAVGVAVYASFAAAALLGRLLRRPAASRGVGLMRAVTLSAAPAVLFFVVTNFAVWASMAMYPHTPAGLADCYAAALPFFRKMLAGDVAYTAVLLASAAAAGAFSLRGLPRIAPNANQAA
ncbi:MAG: DUF6580 family putative transport protein [Planctomycetota bacterium]